MRKPAVCASHTRGMPLVVKENEPADPVRVRAFGAAAIVAHSDRLANLIEQLAAGRLRPRGRCPSRRRPRIVRHDERKPTSCREVPQQSASVPDAIALTGELFAMTGGLVRCSHRHIPQHPL